MKSKEALRSIRIYPHLKINRYETNPVKCRFIFEKHPSQKQVVQYVDKIPKESKVKVKSSRCRRGKYILRLFVTGILPNSTRAIKNINAICEKYLKGRYELEIIDIYQQPSLALSEEYNCSTGPDKEISITGRKNDWRFVKILRSSQRT